MPEGPRIPVHLMNEVDEGRVVFFCGAGVSVGDGSNLPNFEELVDHVYEANRIEADEVEREALRRDDDRRDRVPLLRARLQRRRNGAAAMICQGHNQMNFWSVPPPPAPPCMDLRHR